MIDGVDQLTESIGGIDPQMRHAAMGDPAVLNDFEPVHTAMPDADAIDIGWFSDDNEIGLIGLQVSMLGQVRDAGKTAAFLVHRSALFHGAAQLHSAATDGFHRKYGSRDSRFLVGGAAAIKFESRLPYLRWKPSVA